MVKRIAFVFIRRIDRYALYVDDSLCIVNGMSRKVSQYLQREIGVRVFLGQMKRVRAEIAYVYRYIEIRNLPLGGYMPVDFDVSIGVIQCDFPIESSRCILAVEPDVVLFVLFIRQRRNHAFDIRLGIPVLVSEPF